MTHLPRRLDDFFFLPPLLVRPSSRRRLFTVAAAICLARRLDRPRLALDSLMCSYCRSSLLLQALGMMTLLQWGSEWSSQKYSPRAASRARAYA